MAEPPSAEELVKAASSLKNGKTGGESETLPEMVKAGCQSDEFHGLLLDLVHTHGERRRFPRNGLTLCWYLCLRRVTSAAVTTGKESAY